MSTETAADRLMKGACEYYSISMEELHRRITVGGESLMHQYYLAAFPDGW
jgi:hypothetical protein